MIPSIEVWVAAGLKVAVLSYVLYRENPAYRVAEAIFVGVPLGNVVVMAVRSLVSSGLNPLIEGDAVPITRGLLLFSVYSKRLGKLSQWPVAVMGGVGVGLAIRGAVHTYIYDQIKASVGPVVVLGDPMATQRGPGAGWSGLHPFLFPLHRRGGKAGGPGEDGGVVLHDALLRAMFGQVAMTRITYISGRAQFLVQFLAR